MGYVGYVGDGKPGISIINTAAQGGSTRYVRVQGIFSTLIRMEVSRCSYGSDTCGRGYDQSLIYFHHSETQQPGGERERTSERMQLFDCRSPTPTGPRRAALLT